MYICIYTCMYVYVCVEQVTCGVPCAAFACNHHDSNPTPLRLDDDAHAESSFEVTLRPGHGVHPKRPLVVPPSSSQYASTKASSDAFGSFVGDKVKSVGVGGGNVMMARGWGGGHVRPQGRSVKWGALPPSHALMLVE
jgi:hypothetical protein